MSALKVLLYLEMALTKSYSCIECYAMNMLASFFYFVGLLAVVHLFSHILDLGSKVVNIIYSKHWLFVGAALKGIVDVTATIYCFRSDSLGSFFASRPYEFYTLFDIIQNLFYSSILTFYAVSSYLRYFDMNSTICLLTQNNSFDASLPPDIDLCLGSGTLKDRYEIIKCSIYVY